MIMSKIQQNILLLLMFVADTKYVREQQAELARQISILQADSLAQRKLLIRHMQQVQVRL